MMEQLVDRFPAQLVEALDIASRAVVNKHSSPIRNVYVSGMGGSGIGGNFVAEFVRAECKVPYLVGKGYDIPNWINKHTLVIASSYSGNTEETLSAINMVLQTGAKVVCVASGGKLLEIAKENKLDYISLPNDWPSPRACLGFSLVQQLGILNKLGLISGRALKQVASAAKLLEKQQPSIKKAAAKTAQQLADKLPVIYTTDRMEAVAVRFRQQVNENAKLLCWHHAIPEMNHNELMGWRDVNHNIAVVYFRSQHDFARNAVRIEINKQMISQFTPNIIELWSKGKSLIEEALYLVHYGDFVSCYMCDYRKMDSIEIKAIDYLKGELAKV